MTDIHSQIQPAIDSFVRQITTIARKTAVDLITDALMKNQNDQTFEEVRQTLPQAPQPQTQIRESVVTQLMRGNVEQHDRHESNGKRVKRDSSNLGQVQTLFLKFVEKHPGLRIEEINKQLGTTTKELQLPIRKLIADGEIKTKGNKRSTIYFIK